MDLQTRVNMDARVARAQPEALDEIQRADYNPEYRIDLERVRFSPYFSRLSAVTQVISQAGASPLIHNRLTHSLKVTAVSRAIAVAVDNGLVGTTSALSPQHSPGGCDAVVVQAAASAHDLGHPPFGHLGENVLNRIARDTLGLADGFEGNAQTYRILTALDVCDGATQGLNLTAAVRTAVSKYPWTPAMEGLDLGEAHGPGLPRGLKRVDGEVVARKYSAYFLEQDDLEEARRSAPGLAPWEQSLECSVMDIADDIAYSIHDVDDFYRAGILSQVAVSREFKGWLENATELRLLAAPELELAGVRNHAGEGLEALRRRIHRDDPWIADDDAFAEAVRVVSDDLVEGLLSTVFDGSIAAERRLSTFTSTWIAHFERSIVPAPPDTPRTGIVTLDTRAWHEVKVLKFVHKHFILNRPDIAMYQRGLSQVLVGLVSAFTEWLDDDHDRKRVPRRLIEMVDLATDGYQRLAAERPYLVEDTGQAHLRRLGRGRGVIDYVASLSDGQAIAVAEALNGRTDRLWDIGQSL
ncbi:deoxyguanosinetriphosphate triphosphohydrolase family protein [Herbiconiux solani]|uniref:deoxyguanosinetriphosphate triphosphohydrolase family protein n=1 Tax=Herbiconiux solani TaxID=661329 RepID=UPI000824DC87|nr:dNTP triphosphohydrolase [Herbiconiux solani]